MVLTLAMAGLDVQPTHAMHVTMPPGHPTANLSALHTSQPPRPGILAPQATLSRIGNALGMYGLVRDWTTAQPKPPRQTHNLTQRLLSPLCKLRGRAVRTSSDGTSA